MNIWTKLFLGAFIFYGGFIVGRAYETGVFTGPKCGVYGCEYKKIPHVPTPYGDLITSDAYMLVGGRTPEGEDARLILNNDGKVYLAPESILAIAKTIQIMDTLKMKENNYLFMWNPSTGYQDYLVDYLLDEYQKETRLKEKSAVESTSAK